MSLEEPMAENTLIEIGMNLYSFKWTTVFQSTIMTLITNMKST